MIQCVTSPLFLFLAIWSTAIGLYLAGVFTGLFPSPRVLTLGALLLNVGTFSLGYLTWTLVRGLTPPRLEPLGVEIEPGLSRRMQRALAFALLMGLIALLLMFYRVLQIAAHTHTGVLELLTRPRLLRFQLIEFIERSAWQISPTIMLTSLTSGLFAIGFILLGVFLRLDTTRRRYVYLGGFLLVALATCLMNLSRYDLTTSVLYLVLSYAMTPSCARGTTDRRPMRDLWPAAISIVIIFAAVELLLHKSATYGRAGGLRGLLFSFYWYLASPLAAFNDFLAHFQGDYTLGEHTLAPFFKWLHRFHLIPPHRFLISGEFICIPYPVNVYTYLRSFYEDFGLVGVAVVPYVFGALLAALRDPARRHFPYLNVYILVLVPLMFSFFHFWLLSSMFYLQIVAGFLLFRFDLPDFGVPGVRRAGPDHSGPGYGR